MGGGLALDAGWVLIIVLVAGLLAAAGIAARRTVLERGGGSVECGLRRGPDRGWQLGLAVYQPDELRWYSAFSIRMRPGEVLTRAGLVIVSRRPAAPAEVARLGRDVVVIECQTGGPASGTRISLGGAAASPPPPADLAAGPAGPAEPGGAAGAGPGGPGPAGPDADGAELVELAMSEAVLTGFLAWLEAAPPGDLPGFE